MVYDMVVGCYAPHASGVAGWEGGWVQGTSNSILAWAIVGDVRGRVKNLKMIFFGVVCSGQREFGEYSIYRPDHLPPDPPASRRDSP